MYYFYLTFFIVIGLCIGSFLNVCIHRIPRGQSIVFPPSHCPNCNNRIKIIDLIPVLSYIFLGGKCRNCGQKISIRYPLIEMLTGLLFGLLYMEFGLTLKLMFFLVLTSILIMIFFIDLEHMIIPDGLNLIIGLLGITLNIVYPQNGYLNTFLNMLYGFLLGGVLFYIFGLFGAMGGGDIKLMAALGLLFGWKMLIPLMFLSFVFGGVIGTTLLALKIKKMKDMIPFGPYIVISTIVIMFYGSQILDWYIGYFKI